MFIFVFAYINTLDFYNFHVATVSCLISPRSSALGQLTTYKPMIKKKNLARWSKTQFLNFLNLNKYKIKIIEKSKWEREREVPLIVDIKKKHVVIFKKKNPSRILCLLVLREIKSEHL